MVTDRQKKYLTVAGLPEKLKELKFQAVEEKLINSDENILFQICPLTHDHLVQLQIFLNYLKPSCTKEKSIPSFGTGDRLGIATPAHIQAFQGKNIFPVLAQLSTREITRTESSLQKVLDNALWGCVEVGHEGPFGADADHIKDLDNLQEAINCGFKLYTLDPSDHINNDVMKLTREELKKEYQRIPATLIHQKLLDNGTINKGDISLSTVNRFVNQLKIENNYTNNKDMRRYERAHICIL